MKLIKIAEKLSVWLFFKFLLQFLIPRKRNNTIFILYVLKINKENDVYQSEIFSYFLTLVSRPQTSENDCKFEKFTAVVILKISQYCVKYILDSDFCQIMQS